MPANNGNLKILEGPVADAIFDGRRPLLVKAWWFAQNCGSKRTGPDEGREEDRRGVRRQSEHGAGDQPPFLFSFHIDGANPIDRSLGGIFFGDWSSGDLQLDPVTVSDFDAKDFIWTTLASSD